MIIWKLTGRSTMSFDDSVIGLYTTKEKAEAKIKLMLKTAKEHGWDKTGFSITEVEVE
jgi:hypothetical protein